jgi:threonine/homoserine/homoserine lactone efflux protein
MSIVEFTLSVLLLLATPGPTNTLMALGGYARGWARALPLIPGEITGYLTVIVPVATLAAPFFDAYPQATFWTKVAAGCWVLYLSHRLWTAHRTTDGAAAISTRQVFLTTTLNPKALIIALVIMPHAGLADLLPSLGLFSMLVLFAANGWILFGSLMRHSRRFEIKPVFVQRLAAACLFVFAMILAGASLRAMA